MWLSANQTKVENSDSCALNPKWYAPLLVDIANQFDLRFKVIDRYNDVCKEVRDAVKIGDVAAVVIHAYGTPEKLQLLDGEEPEKPKGRFQRIIEWYYGKPKKPETFPKCLSELPSTSRIFLLGGSTGNPINGDITRNLAYNISREAHRSVFAPTGGVISNKVILKSYDPVELYQPSDDNALPLKKENIFTEFSE